MLNRRVESEDYSSDSYSLRFLPDRPFVNVYGPQGQTIAELFALSGVDSDSGMDDITGLETWCRSEAAGDVVYSLEATSSVWDRKVVRFRCSPTRFRYEVEIQGTGALSDVSYFGGHMSALPRWGSGFFLSGHTFAQLFNPEPNTEDRNYLSPLSGSVIDLTGAPLPGKRHWFFNPPPFYFVAQVSGSWVGLGV